MGTYYSVKIDHYIVDKVKIQNQVDLLLRDLNQTFSTYIKDSELSLLNRADNQTKVNLSKDMVKVLELAQKIFKESEAAFDPTIGPLVNRWGFGPEKNKTQPTDEEIQQILAETGADQYRVFEGVFSKKKSKLFIDLSAIAKGYAVDRVANFLSEEKGFKNILVEIGGEVRALGRKINSNWAIGIERPSEQLGSEIQKVIPLLNMSVATSGSYRNYLKYGDKVFSHTIDPRSGKPVEHKLVSVTVIHANCAQADAWATALMVMGPDKGLNFAQKRGLLAFFLVKTDNGFKELSTTAFNLYLNNFKGR